MEKEYIYNASIVDADTDDIIARIQSFSQEGLEEEMGHSKWSEATKRYEEKLAKELEDELEEEKELEKEKLPPVVVENEAPDFLQPEGENLEAANEELEFAANQDFKLEEDLINEEEETK